MHHLTEARLAAFLNQNSEQRTNAPCSEAHGKGMEIPEFAGTSQPPRVVRRGAQQARQRQTMAPAPRVYTDGEITALLRKAQ